jgi:hypothetical protein
MIWAEIGVMSQSRAKNIKTRGGRLRTLFGSGALSILFISFASGISLQVWAEESPVAEDGRVLKPGLVSRDTVVRISPDDQGRVLAVVKKRVKLQVFIPSRDGWLRCYFEKPISGARYGWVRADAVNVDFLVTMPTSSSGSEQTASSSPMTPAVRGDPASPPTPWNYIFSFHTGIRGASPSDFQNAIGVAQDSLQAMELSVSALTSWGKRGVAWARLQRFSGSALVGDSSDSSYAISLNSAILGAGYRVFENSWSLLSVNLGVGMGIGSMTQDYSSSLSIEVSPIYVFPFEVSWMYRVFPVSNFGVGLDLGYQMLSMGQVQAYSFESGSLVQSPLGMSGLFVMAAFSFRL